MMDDRDFSKETTIGVIGHTGMVGGTTFRYFKDAGYPTFGFSPSQPEDEQKAFGADVVFIGVPTPFKFEGDGFSDALIDVSLQKVVDAWAKREDIKYSGQKPVVVIKSTVWVGTVDKFQAKYPGIKLLFNPEFLSEATCDMDFRNPDRQFVGYTEESKDMATRVLHLLPESPYDLICPAKEAELLKYINNMHGCLSIMEANHFYDVCQHEGLDYERVIKAAESSKWVGAAMGRHYHTIFHKGFRGFGGKCFPKDINAWIQWCKKEGIDVRLLEVTRDLNKELLASQGYTEAQSEQL